MELVEVKNHEIFCDSYLVSKKFEIKHAYFVDSIKRMLLDYPDLRVGKSDPKQNEIYWIERRDYRGKEFECYIM